MHKAQSELTSLRWQRLQQHIQLYILIHKVQNPYQQMNTNISLLFMYIHRFEVTSETKSSYSSYNLNPYLHSFRISRESDWVLAG